MKCSTTSIRKYFVNKIRIFPVGLLIFGKKNYFCFVCVNPCCEIKLVLPFPCLCQHIGKTAITKLISSTRPTCNRQQSLTQSLDEELAIDIFNHFQSISQQSMESLYRIMFGLIGPVNVRLISIISR